MADVYYRYEDFMESSGGYDMSGEWEAGPSVLRVRIVTYSITRKTLKGAWVRGPDGDQLILDHWNKKFANPTRDGARKDFIARKRYLIAFQTRRIQDAQLAIAHAERDELEALSPDIDRGNLKRVHRWELSA